MKAQDVLTVTVTRSGDGWRAYCHQANAEGVGGTAAEAVERLSVELRRLDKR